MRMPSSKRGCEYNVAGFVRDDQGFHGNWEFGYAFKRKDGRWDFYPDRHVGDKDYKRILTPRHIRIYGEVRCR